MTRRCSLAKSRYSRFIGSRLIYLAEAAGSSIRDCLESAITQPQTAWCYDPTADLFDLATAYAFHLAKNHAFQDGNKRVALHAALAFLRVNGVRIVTTEGEMFEAMWSLVIGASNKPQFAEFYETIKLRSLLKDEFRGKR